MNYYRSYQLFRLQVVQPHQHLKGYLGYHVLDGHIALEPGPSLSSNPGPSHSSEPGPSYASEPGPSHHRSSSLNSAIHHLRRGHSTVSGQMSGSVQLPSLSPCVSLSEPSPNVSLDDSPHYVPSPRSSISDIENEVRPDLTVIIQ
jgi:hypothetical protein